MRLPQALSGWQRWLGGKILLVQVTEGKMHLERRGWEGLTEHQKKGEENRNRRKKKLKSPLILFGAFAAVTLSKVSRPVNKGYSGTCTPGQEASV